VPRLPTTYWAGIYLPSGPLLSEFMSWFHAVRLVVSLPMLLHKAAASALLGAKFILDCYLLTYMLLGAYWMAPACFAPFQFLDFLAHFCQYTPRFRRMGRRTPGNSPANTTNPSESPQPLIKLSFFVYSVELFAVGPHKSLHVPCTARTAVSTCCCEVISGICAHKLVLRPSHA
jgi:hypothetical protein